ncbi:MAG: TIGR02117 family protein, partial [Planctomycetota bacterium]
PQATRFVPLEGFPDGGSHVSFGWGDRGFYLRTPTWSDLELSTALRAILLPSASVMHVEHFWGPPEPGPSCRRLVLSEAQYGRLVAYIEESFRKDAAGRPMRIPGRGYDQYDDFYEARGSYHLFYTCNNWANQGLKASGVRTALWSPFETAIFHHLEAR